MSISKADVMHVAKLARLSLSEAEQEQFTLQLNAILKYAEKLNELHTDDVAPTSHVLPITNVMREDVPRPSVSVETALRNAPEDEDGQFRVPAVIE